MGRKTGLDLSPGSKAAAPTQEDWSGPRSRSRKTSPSQGGEEGKRSSLQVERTIIRVLHMVCYSSLAPKNSRPLQGPRTKRTDLRTLVHRFLRHQVQHSGNPCNGREIQWNLPAKGRSRRNRISSIFAI